MRSRVRVVQGRTTVGSSHGVMVASVPAVRCSRSSTSSVSSSEVGGAGFAGRNASPESNSQVRQDPGATSDVAVATGAATRENASEAPLASAEPTKDRRVKCC
jgi:hypothetical protein